MGKNLVKAAGLLLVINTCVKLLGFVREMVIANGFGASSASDAYLVAYTIPYFLQAILGYAFVSAVLPLFSGLWREDGAQDEAYRLGSTLINIVALAMLALSLLGVAAAPLLVRLTAPGLAAADAALAARLTRVIFPSLLFMSVGLVVSGILNSRYRFAAAALAPGVAALGVIAAALLANGDIYVVAVGTLLGFVGFWLLQAGDLAKSGFRYQLVCDLRHPAVRRVLRDVLPIVLGLSVNQIYTIINRIFASALAPGSISALNYASKLMNLPLGLFVAAIITAVFPALADLARAPQQDGLARTVSRGLAMCLLIVVPSALGLMLLDAPIVRLLFEHGSFTAADTQVTAEALFAMCPGLPFLAVSMLLMRVCYAMGDVKTPLLTGGVSILVNILVSLALVRGSAHIGLSWANSAAAAANALLMAALLSRRLRFADAYLRRNLGLAVAGGAAMSLALLATRGLWPQPIGRTGQLGLILALMAGAAAVYFLTLRLGRCEALRDISRALRRGGPGS